MKKKFIVLFLVLLLLPHTTFADTTTEYSVIPGQNYRVLIGEILNNEGNVLHRVYDIYSGLSGMIDYKGSISYGKKTENHQVDIELSRSFTSLKDAKEWLGQKEPEKLELLPYTIVSEEVLNQWSKEGYNPVFEYWRLSPKGFVSYDIDTDYAVIPKPYIIPELKGPDNIKVNFSVNGRSIKFRNDTSYVVENNNIVVPIAEIAHNMGYNSKYIVDENLVGSLVLEKGPRIIEISPWWDYIIINGNRIKFNTKTRLSLNEKIIVPLDLFYFMAADVIIEEQENKIFVDIKI